MIKFDEIEAAIHNLLVLADSYCTNSISSNLFFILSNKNEVIGDNFEIIRKKRVALNLKKKPKKLTEIFDELTTFSDAIYDLTLYIFKSEKDKTIIEIRYFLKSSIDASIQEQFLNYPAMIHSKIAFPPYRKNDQEKFDVNWELGGFLYH